MSSVARVLLPDSAGIDEVASVVGRCFGRPVDPDTLTWQVLGVKIKVGNHPSYCTIDVMGEGGIHLAHLTYHNEISYAPGRLVQVGSSCAERIALARRLADFFGGQVDYSDEDADARVFCDYTVPARPWADNRPRDDDPVARDAFRARIAAVKPLSRQEIHACRPFAVVPVRENEGYQATA